MSGDMSSESAYLFAYGVYLSNGGSREGFEDLTYDEVQLIYTVTMARQRKFTNDIVLNLVKAIAKMFGGND